MSKTLLIPLTPFLCSFRLQVRVSDVSHIQELEVFGVLAPVFPAFDDGKVVVVEDGVALGTGDGVQYIQYQLGGFLFLVDQQNGVVVIRGAFRGKQDFDRLAFALQQKALVIDAQADGGFAEATSRTG